MLTMHAGVCMSIWWVLELFSKGTYLVINFGRPGGRVTMVVLERA